MRERAGLLDMTSFAKYEVSGPGAEAFLDRLCANALPREGRIALTQMLTPRGGIECDLTVTRLAPDRFYLITAAGTETHDLEWIERHLPPDGSVVVENVTGRWGVLAIAGPRSREILESVCDDDLSAGAFPFMAAREIRVGSVPVRALRATYTGELGWELHHPIEYSRTLHDLLIEAGGPLGLADIGYRALESLRLEKGYRLWGVDIMPQCTPLEAGLERFVRFEKGDFIGRDALLRQRDAGIARSARVPDHRPPARRRPLPARRRADLRGRSARQLPARGRPGALRGPDDRARLSAAVAQRAGDAPRGRDPRRAARRIGRRGTALRPQGGTDARIVVEVEPQTNAR